MHDLLHDLALKVASHDCLSLHLPNVGSLEIQPSTRHLSIITEHLDEYDEVSAEILKSQLEEMKKTLNVEHLQSLMLFGEMDDSFAKIFGYYFREAKALRVLYVLQMKYPIESMLHNFSGLVHLRCLCLGTKDSEMHLPLNISKFYHLRVLDLEPWHGIHDFPEDLSNLAKLCHIHTFYDEIYSDIYNVGKLELLEELKVYRVKKKSEGFEAKQLEHLTKLRELGIYNLEKLRTKEEAVQAKLIEKSYLRRLTLDWDSERSTVEPSAEAVVLESLLPHGDLQVLCIRGHGGPSCPTWLGDGFAVEALQSLYLYGVSWEVFPSLAKAWDLRELRFEDIAGLKEFVIEKRFCMLIKLELIGLRSFEKWVYSAEEESSLDGDLFPSDTDVFPLLQVLIIRRCPKLFGLPSSDWFPKLQELEIKDCPEFLSVIPMSWIDSLRHVTMHRVKLLDGLKYSKSSNGVELEIIGNHDLYIFGKAYVEFFGKNCLDSIDQVLVFDKETCLEKLKLKWCPPLQLKHRIMLTSLKTLIIKNSAGLVGPLGGQGVEWKLPIERIKIWDSNGNSRVELTELLPHLPKLSKLKIHGCRNIKKLVVGVDVQQTISEASEMGGGEITAAAAAEREDDGVLQFPARLCDSLQELDISGCPELVLVDSPTLVPGGGWLQALLSLQRFAIQGSPKFLPNSFSRHFFPPSLQLLSILDVEGMGTLEPLTNLSSLTKLRLFNCGEDLKGQGLQYLLSTGGQLNELDVLGSPRFFAGWDPNPKQALEETEGDEEQQTQLVSSTLQKLCTNDAAGFLSAPICSFLSSSLTNLDLCESWSEGVEPIERFSKEQEDALQLLSSLQNLEFRNSRNLQQLPAGLSNLTSLKKLTIKDCPAISSLPKDGLPKSLQELDVHLCDNKELKQQCRGLVGTIPRISINTYGILGD